MASLKLNLIAACDSKMGIGVNNALPWHLRKEMAYFNRMTTGIKHPGSESEFGTKKNVVLMGRKTYDSIPENFRPLKNRLNIVLSRNAEIKPDKDIVACRSWEEAMKYLALPEIRTTTEKVWVVGGSHIYKLAIESPFCHRIYLTQLFQDFNCDTFFPTFNKEKFHEVKDDEVPQEEQEEKGIKYTFHVYEKAQGDIINANV